MQGVDDQPPLTAASHSLRICGDETAVFVCLLLCPRWAPIWGFWDPVVLLDFICCIGLLASVALKPFATCTSSCSSSSALTLPSWLCLHVPPLPCLITTA